MLIESGPTTERRVRTLLGFSMVAVFALWFAYDGWIGYPADNMEKHLEQLTAEERAGIEGEPPVYESVAAERDGAAAEALKQLDLTRQGEALIALYGGEPSFRGSDAWYYFGPAHRVKLSLEGGMLRDVMPQAAQKSVLDILLQKGLAVALCVVGLVLGWKVFGVMRTRLRLDDEGLVYRGRGRAAWDEMKSLRTGEFEKKGWVDLVYTRGGAERLLRLDEYHLAEFAMVLNQICDRMGFENPLTKDEPLAAASDGG